MSRGTKSFDKMLQVNFTQSMRIYSERRNGRLARDIQSEYAEIRTKKHESPKASNMRPKSRNKGYWYS